MVWRCFHKKIGILIFLFPSLCTADSIPESDFSQIRDFFHFALHHTAAPYTLFGEKPICIIEYNVKTNPLYVRESSLYYHLRKSYFTWKKYAQLFSSKKYVIIENKTEDLNDLRILIINKELCYKTIKENLFLFQEILQQGITAEEMLQRIESSDDLFDVLGHHQGLLGLLLGFGQHNAFAFHDLHERQIPRKSLTIFNNESNIELLPFSALNFMVDEDDPETALLREKYNKNKMHFIEMDNKRNLVEQALRKLEDK